MVHSNNYSNNYSKLFFRIKAKVKNTNINKQTKHINISKEI